MKRLIASAAAVLLFAQPAIAAQRDLGVEVLTKFTDGRRTWRERGTRVYSFHVQVISDREGPKPEGSRDGRPLIEAQPGEEYRVRIHNPLPVRVAANLTIDGLNSITGRPGTPSGGRKWVIEPESWVDIPGWQVSDRTARRFFFTTRAESYAAWRSDSWGRDLAANCGVIGVAYFWSRRELDDYFDGHPVLVGPREYGGVGPGGRGEGRSRAPLAGAARDTGAPAQEQIAGTGMGGRESNPVRRVDFDYDRGMYRAADAVVLFYDFAPERPVRPRPFEDPGYAPEQPGHRERRR